MTQPAPVQKKLTPVQLGCGCLSAFAIVVVALVALMSGHHPTPDNQTADSRTPLQQKVAAALEREKEAEKADALMPDEVRKAEVGVTTTIVGPGTEWPCASSKSALPQLMKWQRAMLDEQSPDSVMSDYARALMRTKSIMIGARARVKILGKAPGVRRISVIDTARYSGYQAVTAQGCWVAAEAVVR